ncbi:MAG: hypothetical protein EPO07_05870 [Verrucomicrobia bacterium]|nr:MAG: hypothetical protein EPO07_05870 [Verrucomicrobiota bacterium]
MNSKPIVALSIALNLALAAALAWAVSRKPAPADAPAASASAAASASNDATTKAAKATASVTPAATTPLKAFDWRMVESEDYKKYIANLRSIGCPEETIRDIIVADVNKLFESRRREMNATTNKFQFWKAGNPLAGMMDPKRMEKQQALNQEKRTLLKELLGVVPDEKPDLLAGFNPFESMLDFLPASKQNQVTDIYMKYQAKIAGAMGNGTPDAEDLKNMQKVQKDMDAELAKLMSPEEYQDYQLRMSQTAMMMRMQLGSFEPSEQEFRDIFKLKKPFDDDYSNMFGMATGTKEEKEKRAAAEKEMKSQIKALLGDERYADYERAQDYAYQSIYRTTDRYGLGKDAANKVYDMKKAAEDEARKIRNDKTLDKDQRTAALAGIRAETEKSIQTVMGDKAWSSYQSQPGNYWLRGLSPDPKKD